MTRVLLLGVSVGAFRRFASPRVGSVRRCAAAYAAARDAFLVSSFSDGVLRSPEASALLKAAVHRKSSGETVRLCYVPTASYALRSSSENSPGVQRQRARRDGKSKRDRIVGLFGGPERCDAVTLDLWDASVKHVVGSGVPSSAEDVLSSWEPHLVVVDGGNTFWLRDCMEAWLPQLAASTAVYVGVSAGAICAGHRVDTALWKGWDDPNVVEDRDWADVRGLDLAGGASFFPHHAPEWESLVAEKSTDNYAPLVTLHEKGCFVLSQSGESSYLRANHSDAHPA